MTSSAMQFLPIFMLSYFLIFTFQTIAFLAAILIKSQKSNVS